MKNDHNWAHGNWLSFSPRDNWRCFDCSYSVDVPFYRNPYDQKTQFSCIEVRSWRELEKYLHPKGHHVPKNVIDASHWWKQYTEYGIYICKYCYQSTMWSPGDKYGSHGNWGTYLSCEDARDTFEVLRVLNV